VIFFFFYHRLASYLPCSASSSLPLLFVVSSDKISLILAAPSEGLFSQLGLESGSGAGFLRAFPLGALVEGLLIQQAS